MLATAVAVVVGLCLQVPNAAADVPSRPGEVGVQALPLRLNVMSWNICGASHNACDDLGDAAQKVDRIVQVTKERNVHVILLQEACELSHSKALPAKLTAAGLGNWAVYHSRARNYNTGEYLACTNEPAAANNYAGPAVLMKKFPRNSIKPEPAVLPDVPADPYSVSEAACLRDEGNGLFACSAHFANEGFDAENGDPTDTREAQAARYAEVAAEKRAEGYTTFIGGDLNISKSYMLQPLESGNIEADALGRWTSGLVKLDYIYADASQWERDSLAGVYSPEGLSDHQMLVGFFSWFGEG
ncbi:endonuclease/exonuclease/phosphatase family protein [Streptomyces sp. NPDC058155]|uniref:endonuclease/exonuclease/phosphatase family protein n=1 Tax=Streptomyces sp. NPDC058155 TaxID=3346359 RepID=UPI0036E05F12